MQMHGPALSDLRLLLGIAHDNRRAPDRSKEERAEQELIYASVKASIVVLERDAEKRKGKQ